MKVLVIGSGAREHAIVWKCLQSKMADRVFCAPGNAGIGMIAQCVDIRVDDIEGLVAFAKEYHIDFTIVGPELPLMMGIVDRFEEEGLLILGPRKDAALIEGSKIFAKNVLDNCGLSHTTAPYKIFANPDRAKEYIEDHGVPCVIKKNGLASGKGVVVAKSIKQGRETVDEFMSTEEGRLILIEDFLDGWECSFTILTDGWNILPFPVSRDYKQDLKGNNTGGVGAFCPVPGLSEEHYHEILRYIRLVLNHLRETSRPYKGFLYPGVIITKDGPKFLEFNCRLGDPEAQVVLPLLRSDFVELCYAAACGNQNATGGVRWWNNCAFVNVVIASPGYPGKPRTGYRLYGLEEAAKQGALMFHGGTKLNEKGNIVNSGGRILSVVGRGYCEDGEDIRVALEKARYMAYRSSDYVSLGNKDPSKGKHWYRKDIALEV